MENHCGVELEDLDWKNMCRVRLEDQVWSQGGGPVCCGVELEDYYCRTICGMSGGTETG